jgi:E1A/CREB-binding protein
LQNTGTSLLETFDMLQIRDHVELIRQAAYMQRTPQTMPVNPDDACRVCQQTKLTFEPPCLYCTQCGQRIKRGQVYHTTPPEVDNKAFWCHSCFSGHNGDKVPYDGAPEGFVAKPSFIKKKNDEEIEEGWVQCDHCNMWVHMICGLFNKGRNDKDVHYLCPDCLLRVSSQARWINGL